MEFFKLAFETTMVGLLAFLWLGVAVDLLFPALLSRLGSAFVQQNQTLMGAGLLSIAYCLGSVILPVSDQFVNDEHWPLPEDAIRCRVVIEESGRLNGISAATLSMHNAYIPDAKACKCPYWDPFCDKKNSVPNHQLAAAYHGAQVQYGENHKTRGQLGETEISEQDIVTLFQLQEGQVLNQGSDKSELFKQLHERIVVLRGAVFSGSILFLICLFGSIAPSPDEPFSWRRRLLGLVLASVFTLFAVHAAHQDLNKSSIFDIPILETILAAVSMFGGFLVVRGVSPRPFLKWHFVVIIGLCVVFAYGGWFWSEVIYDQQIINSVAVSENTVGKPTIRPSQTPADTPPDLYQAQETP